MTIKKLIEKLQTFDKNNEIKLCSWENNNYKTITEVRKAVDKENLVILMDF